MKTNVKNKSDNDMLFNDADDDDETEEDENGQMDEVKMDEDEEEMNEDEEDMSENDNQLLSTTKSKKNFKKKKFMEDNIESDSEEGISGNEEEFVEDGQTEEDEANDESDKD